VANIDWFRENGIHFCILWQILTGLYKMKSNRSNIVANFDMFRENEIHLVKKLITSSISVTSCEDKH
jgi:hypothetical protein